MMLGDIIARFEDEAAATQALADLRNPALTTRIGAAAAEEDLTIGEFATRAVERFVAGASDEDWVTIVGRMSRTDDPGRAFLAHVLGFALQTQHAGRAAHLSSPPPGA
ncbi:MAG TPA: hypothetical protein VNR11_13060 [Xanthobacteraceae bacterium]|nr:hypothetical protein [Xanthobacteraceae bacterium]